MSEQQLSEKIHPRHEHSMNTTASCQPLPSACLALIEERAELNRWVREFFSQRSVLEIETPILSQAAVSDPYIQPVTASVLGKTYYLQTSPEYPMKRFLCAHPRCIYQIAKVFRQGEAGTRHNPEFSMLEWYRMGFDHQQLMDEVAELVSEYLGITQQWRVSYGQLFAEYLNINPFTATDEALWQKLQQLQGEFPKVNRLGLLDLLMTHYLEPQLPRDTLVFVDDFPADQAALARIESNASGCQSVAKRFELYVNGYEIANGYWELADAEELRQRFQQDQCTRKDLGQAPRPLDEPLLAAMASGFPDCAGVALGLDRLLMLKTQQPSIKAVLSFDIERA